MSHCWSGTGWLATRFIKPPDARTLRGVPLQCQARPRRRSKWAALMQQVQIYHANIRHCAHTHIVCSHSELRLALADSASYTGTQNVDAATLMRVQPTNAPTLARDVRRWLDADGGENSRNERSDCDSSQPSARSSLLMASHYSVSIGLCCRTEYYQW